MNEKQLKQEFVEYASLLYKRGYAFGSAGNISIRLDDSRLLASPTGSSLGRLKADGISTLDYSGNLIEGSKPSKEIAFHLALYTDPKCNSIIHLHSTWSTLLSCQVTPETKEVIKPFTPYYVMKIKNVKVIPYYAPGSPQLGEEMGKWAGKCNVFLLQNHGLVVVGNSLEDAVNTVEEFEETAKLNWLMQGMKTRYLSDEEISRLTKPD